MKRGRRIISGFMAGALVLCFSSCGKKEPDETKKRVKVSDPDTTESDTEMTDDVTDTSDTSETTAATDYHVDKLDIYEVEAELVAILNPEKFDGKDFFDTIMNKNSVNAYCLVDEYLTGEPFDDFIFIEKEYSENIVQTLDFFETDMTQQLYVQFFRFSDEESMLGGTDEMWEQADTIVANKQKSPDDYKDMQVIVTDDYVYYCIEGFYTLELFRCGDSIMFMARLFSPGAPDSLSVLKHNLGLPDAEMVNGYISPTPTPTPDATPTPMPMPDATISEEDFTSVGIEAFAATEVDKDTIEKYALGTGTSGSYCIADEYVETFYGVSLSGVSNTDKVTRTVVFIGDIFQNNTPLELAAGYYVFESEEDAQAAFENLIDEAYHYEAYYVVGVTLEVTDDYILLEDNDIFVHMVYIQDNVIISMGGITNGGFPDPLRKIITAFDLPYWG